MHLRSRLVFSLIALASAAAPSCGGGGGGDQTTNFIGAWRFSSGQLATTCLGSPMAPLDLTGGPVTITKVDDGTIMLTLTGTACMVKFHVSGNQGSAPPNQLCPLDLGGSLGMQSITFTKWALSLSGDNIDNDITGTASVCMASGTAVLMRDTPDAGTGGTD
jgi:hypothetical protein